MITKINFEKSPSFARSITTASGVFTFNIYYNDYGTQWYMRVSDGSGNNVICGIKLIAGIDLIGTFSKSTGLLGTLYLETQSSDQSEPTYDTIEDFYLIYEV